MALNTLSPTTFTTGMLITDIVNDPNGARGVINETLTPSAALDIQSTKGALAVPRMTTVQRNLLTASNGMILYDTTLNQFKLYENGSWTGGGTVTGPGVSVAGDIAIFADTSGTVISDSGVNIAQVPAPFLLGSETLVNDTQLSGVDIISYKDVGLLYTGGNFVVGFHPNTFLGRPPNTVFGFANPSSADATVELTQGALLVSRLTQTQINSLIAVDGMIAYNSTTNLFNFHQDLVWTSFYGPGSPTTIIDTGLGGNFFIGTLAGNTVSPGQFNVGIGYSALHNSSGSLSNTAVGYLSEAAITFGVQNCSVGSLTMQHATSATSNSCVGFGSLSSLISGSNNNAFGASSLTANTASSNNAFGSQSLSSNTSGTQNSAFGHQALLDNVNTSGNSAFGYQSLFSNVSGQNSAFGALALKNNSTSGTHCAFGYECLFNNVDGLSNSALGVTALFANVHGSFNCAVGYLSLQNSTNDFNTGIGSNALTSITSGSSNTAVGYGAGNNGTTLNQCTFIGNQAAAITNSITNATAIGYMAQVGASNSLVLGNGVNVGINATSPAYDFTLGLSATNTATIFIGNSAAAGVPGTPSGGGILFVNGVNLVYKASDGTIHTLA